MVTRKALVGHRAVAISGIMCSRLGRRERREAPDAAQ